MKKILALLLILSVGANLYLFFSKEKAATVIQSTKEYPFLAKRIFLDNANDTIINFTQLRSDLRKFVDNQNTDIGIYFQYLPTGVSIRVNADKPFVAASLLKLPTVIQTQKMIEQGEIKPTDKVSITEEFMDKGSGDLYKVTPGNEMTIDELMKTSLKYSDNTAHRVLFSKVTGGSPVTFYNNLDIPPQFIDEEIAISPRNYASVLHSLYFSSYLSYEGSNKILSYLTEISEGQDLRADIPNEVKIAQKIGIYEKGDKKNEYTYSDCGIYYVPNRQYVLCIMTQGNREISSSRAQKISNMVYEFIRMVNTNQQASK